MQTFTYIAKETTGVNRKGLIEAADESQAAVVLRQHGLIPVSIRQQVAPFGAEIFRRVSRGVPYGELVNFTRQLSTMITAGLTLPNSLLILQKQTQHQRFSEIIADILRNVESGVSLAASMERHPKVFGQIYVNLVRAGESAGVLDNILNRLADNLEKDREFRAKTRGAMVYPAIVLVAMFGVIFLMMIVVIPKLTELFTEMGAQLPLPTKILIALSTFCAKFSWLIIISLVGLVVFLRRTINTKRGREIYDQAILKLPIIGSLRRNTILAEFTRTFGLLVGAGIPILEALKIVSAAVGNTVIEKVLQKAAFAAERGQPLAAPFAAAKEFPPILGQMVKTGEETGKLDEVMGNVSLYFESEAEHAVNNLTTALEPIILIILAAMVTFLIISIILPIYSLTSSF